MSKENEALVRTAYEAYGRGDVTALLELVHPELEWTYLDPRFENPQPQICHGREQLAWALGQQAGRGIVAEVEEVESGGDKVMMAIHTPGADAHGRPLHREPGDTMRLQILPEQLHSGLRSRPYPYRASWGQKPTAV
jgi:ketosteroid isomerase-like protein